MSTLLNMHTSKGLESKDKTSYLQALASIPTVQSEIDLALATNNIAALNSNLNKYAPFFNINGLQHICQAMNVVEKQCLEVKNLFEIDNAAESLITMLSDGKKSIVGFLKEIN